MIEYLDTQFLNDVYINTFKRLNCKACQIFVEIFKTEPNLEIFYRTIYFAPPVTL